MLAVPVFRNLQVFAYPFSLRVCTLSLVMVILLHMLKGDGLIMKKLVLAYFYLYSYLFC